MQKIYEFAFSIINWNLSRCLRLSVLLAKFAMFANKKLTNLHDILIIA